MKVLVLSSTYPSQTNPTLGVFVHERVRHLARLVETVVVAPVPWFPANGLIRGRAVANAPAAEVRDGIAVHHPRFLCPPLAGKTFDAVLYAMSLMPVLRRLRRDFPFDVIDAHFTFPDGVAAVWLGALLSRPVTVTIRGSHDLRQAGFRLRRSQISHALRRTARVIVVSRSLQPFALSAGAHPEQIRVVPNGVDPARFFPSDRTAARARLGLPADRAVLLGVGTLTESKGHRRVIELLPDLLAARPGLTYVAIGNEVRGLDHRRDLERVVQRLGLHGHVWILGPRPHEEIRTWMAAADLFCLATQGEGWCNALTEALACGLPAVTTDVGGNGEIVRHGYDGFLVPFWDRRQFRDAILAALDTPWDRSAIASRAARRSWDHVAREVLAVLEEAVNSSANAVLLESQ